MKIPLSHDFPIYVRNRPNRPKCSKNILFGTLGTLLNVYSFAMGRFASHVPHLTTVPTVLKAADVLTSRALCTTSVT
jgi:hypothetical protein